MIPLRPLFAISAAVLAAHALVLGWVALPLAHTQAATPLVFHTRSLALPAAPAPEAAPPAPPPPAAPAPRRAPRPPAPAAPPPATAMPAPAADAGAPELPAADSAAEPAPAPAAPASVPAAASSAAEDAPPAPAAVAAQTGASAPSAAPVPGIAILAPGAAEDGAGTPAMPVRIPAPVRLGFDVHGQVRRLQYNASAELSWQHDGQQYQARQEIRVLFLGGRAQTSVGEITALGLQPRRFGDRSRSEQAAHFDFAQGQVSFSANTPSAAIAPGTQDRLSVFLQLSAMLAAAPQAYPVGTRIRIPTVSARAADVWTFTIEGEETLDLPLGPVRALLLERLPRRDYDLKAQVWLAPALDYLPARIRITQANGDLVELNLRSRETP